VIAISDTTARDVERLLDVPAGRIRVVTPRIVPIATVGSAPVAVSAASDVVPLLFVGVAEHHKRPELAIATLGALRRRGIEATLTFAGHQPRRIALGLARTVAEASLGGRVTYAGRVDDATLADLYRGSILLATSAVEGFGLPPIESLLSGGRVVAAPIDAYREALGAAGVIASRSDAEALADAVEVARSTASRPADVATVAGRFSSTATMRALLTAYEGLAGG
jgi:glycosyltransferase involved in cell wall biosynthesis